MKQATLTKFDRLMAAVAFAEENEHVSAREFLKEDDRVENRSSKRPEMRKTQSVQKSH